MWSTRWLEHQRLITSVWLLLTDAEVMIFTQQPTIFFWQNSHLHLFFKNPNFFILDFYTPSQFWLHSLKAFHSNQSLPGRKATFCPALLLLIYSQPCVSVPVTFMTVFSPDLSNFVNKKYFSKWKKLRGQSDLFLSSCAPSTTADLGMKMTLFKCQ